MKTWAQFCKQFTVHRLSENTKTAIIYVKKRKLLFFVSSSRRRAAPAGGAAARPRHPPDPHRRRLRDGGAGGDRRARPHLGELPGGPRQSGAAHPDGDDDAQLKDVSANWSEDNFKRGGAVVRSCVKLHVQGLLSLL